MKKPQRQVFFISLLQNRENMKMLVSSFTQHLRDAIHITENIILPICPEKIENVLILGMGGSGIGGSIASQVLSEELKVPVGSCKDYSIPSYVSKNTLIIASSYSGNTEETITALDEAERKTKNIVCICSGGKIKELALEKKFGLIEIPGGMPPRAAFGYSFPQLFKIFNHCNLIQWDLKKQFQTAIDLIEQSEETIRLEARKVAEIICNKLPVIYSESGYEGLCIRFRQQLNENAKKLCWHHVFPEMNHNELVGWREQAGDKVVILLRNDSDLKRNQLRMELSKEIFAKYTPSIVEIYSKGKSKLEKTLYLVHLCDWISVYVAEINKTDALEIEVINYFKNELSRS